MKTMSAWIVHTLCALCMLHNKLYCYEDVASGSDSVLKMPVN